MKNEEKLMQQCFFLAEKGMQFVSPNPLVGSLVVKKNKIIASGFHKKFGGVHAEAAALKKAGKKAKNAVLFVNLEPCCFFGKQPPCTEQIIKAGVKEVVIGVRDPNPLVCGKGIRELKKNKIKVRIGALGKEAVLLNEKFFKFQKTKKPFVLIKNAVSLDGKNFCPGKKKRICGQKSIKKVFELRSEFEAILVGVNTVLKDNPRLTSRVKSGRNPIRIVLDSKARIPLNSKVLSGGAPTIVVCTKAAKKQKLKKIIEKGAGVFVAKEKKGRVDLSFLLKWLGEIGVSSVMVEGGAEVTSAFLKQNLANKMILIVSPKIFGKGKNFLTEPKLLDKLLIKKIERNQKDLWLTFYPKKTSRL